ncbi:MAG TPA: hypothetical protein VNR67_03840 [Solirubrobacterales bacterium]|nr:hypothetical protein [Solirubrobacterales bacterium]
MRRAAARLAILCAAISVGLVIATVPAVAGTVHPFLGSITGERIVPGAEFKGACGVTVDSKGALYLADYYNDEIDVFAANGEFLTRIPAIHPVDPTVGRPLNGPCDLAVDSTGALFVNDFHGDVLRFLPSSFPVTKSTVYGAAVTIDAGSATGIAVDPVSDDLYVDDRTSIALHEAPVTPGAEPQRLAQGSLFDGYGIAVSSGRVLVADAGDARLKVYEPAVDPVSPTLTVVGDGTPHGGFGSLVEAEVAIDPTDGHLYVADNLRPDRETSEAVVHEFSALGHYRGQVPTMKSEGETSFLGSALPSGLAIAPNRTIYVTSGSWEDSAVFIFGPAPTVPTQLLSVARTGAGEGGVASSPPGLGCGGACVAEFDQDSNVTLRAVPERGTRLVGWTGCGSNPTPNSCQVTMVTAKSVTAEFGPAPQTTLAVTVEGSGGGTLVSEPTGIACGGTCEDEFDQGSTVTISARPASGSRIAGWSGCDAQPGVATCAVTMTADRTVAAEFEPVPEDGEEPAAPRSHVADAEWVPAFDQIPFRVSVVSRAGRVATLKAWAPGPGELTVTGRNLRRSSALAFDAGPVRMKVRLDRAASRRLANSERRRLALRVGVAFSPFTDAPAARRSARVVFTRGGGR